ncbi:glycosyl transferase family 2 [Methanosarcinales archaeon ex4572_44]|nr:MAG: glycosyl transferase family 2 [Methanosarcinales archaeon ex4572_44]RLG26236.1 MAG: glycosyl transferase family 2 [Methanosarcinales archaeon]RLG26331.1 MAG: glycosyl transferase family 2 [Methanosarcinales archaeon]HHI30540.1 glycosyltransferase [Candidatus Methanoperedenaceae archaeon]
MLVIEFLLLVTIFFAVPYLFYLLLSTRVDLGLSPAGKSLSHRLSVSIVIPTFNEESIVAGKLDNIFELDYPLELIEVIFVDSSTDSTRQIIGGYQEKFSNIRVIEEGERRGLAVALNEGYAAARGDVVVKTDCDSLLDKGALSHAVANFADPSIGAVSGRQVVLNESLVEEGYRSLQSRVQLLESYLDSTVIFHGPFSAFRKDLIVPIDADSLADDSELAVKIRRQGYRSIIDPSVRFFEASQSRFFKRRVQKDRRGTGLIRLLLRERDILFNSEYGRFGQIVFPMNYFMMIVSPILFIMILVLGFYSLFALSFTLGVLASAGLLAFIYLGQANKLGRLEALYSFVDSQISLVLGGLALFRRGDGKWEVDRELREAYIR